MLFSDASGLGTDSFKLSIALLTVLLLVSSNVSNSVSFSSTGCNEPATCLELRLLVGGMVLSEKGVTNPFEASTPVRLTESSIVSLLLALAFVSVLVSALNSSFVSGFASGPLRPLPLPKRC